MQEKIYLADHGIREAIYGKNSRDIDQVLENIVYMELLRRGYEVTVGKMNQKEVDFIAEKRGEKLHVQVTMTGPLSRALRQKKPAYKIFISQERNNNQPAFQGIMRNDREGDIVN